jgi:phosphatidylserine/phosphatidylglycerophosphate/cardiolipin synthase-like enzyme
MLLTLRILRHALVDKVEELAHRDEVVAVRVRAALKAGHDAVREGAVASAPLRPLEEAHVEKHLGKFLRESWPFGEPRPRLYYDKRALVAGPPWCSLDAKCVVVNGRTAFVSSANFTQRGEERNIEVGVLIGDVSFASITATRRR